MKLDQVNKKTATARRYNIFARWTNYGYIKRIAGLSSEQWANAVVEGARKCADEHGLDYEEVELLKDGESCF